MKSEDVEIMQSRMTNWARETMRLVERCQALEAENQLLRDQLEGMKDICVTALTNACVEAARSIPDVPPPRMPLAAQLSVVGAA